MLKNLFGYFLGFFLIFLVLELISRVVFPQFTSGQISASISKNEFISKGIRQHFLDGYFARMYKISSDLGSLLDLLADKIFISTLLIWMTFNFES